MSWENEMSYLCNVIQKEKSHTDLTDPTDLLSLQATVLTKTHSQNSEGVKIREIREIRVGKQKPPRGEKFVRFERFVFKNQALRSAHTSLTINT